MVTADQLAAHVVGDYFLQSDWMALGKTRRWVPAAAHAALYGLPFLLLSRSPLALAIIVVSHFVIDRWRLARYLCWASNWFAPVRPQPWVECRDTGYAPDRPAWMTTWLLIITDNALHVLINAWALSTF